MPRVLLRRCGLQIVGHQLVLVVPALPHHIRGSLRVLLAIMFAGSLAGGLMHEAKGIRGRVLDIRLPVPIIRYTIIGCCHVLRRIPRPVQLCQVYVILVLLQKLVLTL